MQTSSYPRVSLEFGNWLAGLIDGEGCFQIRARKDTLPICGFELCLRADDTPLLEQCVDTTGLGRLYPKAAHKVDNPQTTWGIFQREQQWRLAEILDHCPMRSKKARDYAIWREALQAWGTVRRSEGRHGGNDHIWEHMLSLREQLQETRTYKALDSNITFTVPSSPKTKQLQL